MTQTITIPKKANNKLKKAAEIDWELYYSLVRGWEDIKHGRVKPLKD